VEIGTWSKPAARLIRFVIRLAFLRRLGDVRPLARIRTQIRDAEVVRLAAQVQLLHDLVSHISSASIMMRWPISHSLQAARSSGSPTPRRSSEVWMFSIPRPSRLSRT
jgi:hypothetical protein